MWKPKFVIFPAVLAIPVLLATSCSREKKIEAKADPPQAPAIAVAKAAPANLTQTMVLAADFRPFQEIEVHAKVAGYVKQIYVDVGDHVQQGQRLATLEIPEMADDLARASAAKRRSDAELARARDELQRAESAHTVAHLSYTRLDAVLKTKPNLVAQQEIDEALGRDRVSEAQVASAKSALAAAEQQVQVAQADLEKIRDLLAYAEITAPFTGVVSKRYADTGAMIQAGTASQTQTMPLVRLSQNDRLRLVLPVPESAVPHIRLGSAVEVRVPTLNRSFPGKVARFSEKVQLSTRTMETEVDVANLLHVLVPGMYAEAVLTLDKREGALCVPILAISGQAHPTVMVVDGQNRLEERPVALGLETAERVEVLTGLDSGDLVVLGNRSQFRAGQLVTPKLVKLALVEREQ